MKSFFLFLLTLYYAIYETTFFGGHGHPSCPEEVIAGGIVFLLAALTIGFAKK